MVVSVWKICDLWKVIEKKIWPNYIVKTIIFSLFAGYITSAKREVRDYHFESVEKQKHESVAVGY